MNQNQAFIALGISFAGGTALGAGVGYILAHRKLITKYEQILHEENEKAKEFYKQLYKVGDYETPQGAAEKLLPAEAAEAVLKYQGNPIPPERVVLTEEGVEIADEEHHRILVDEDIDDERPQDSVPHNVFDDQGDDAILENRDESKPFVITEDELTDNEPGHDTVYLTYYAGDSVLSDDGDQLIEKVDELVGVANLTLFGVGSSSKDVVLVRNNKISTDFEITQVDGSYSRIVLQMGIEDSLSHSQEPKRRGKPRWDDD